jgi:hypothetical protein
VVNFQGGLKRKNCTKISLTNDKKILIRCLILPEVIYNNSKKSTTTDYKFLIKPARWLGWGKITKKLLAIYPLSILSLKRLKAAG